MKNENMLWEKIEKSIKENEKILKKLNEIDNQYYFFQIEIPKLVEILKEKKQVKPEKQMEEKNLLVVHSGNPYLTFLLAIEAIQKKINVTIDVQEVMYGVNKGIIKIIQEILKEEELDIIVNIQNNIIDEKEKISIFDKVIVFGQKDIYKWLKKNKIKSLIYYTSGNMDIYCDCEELKEIEETICKIANQNFMLVERYEECENIEQAIEEINEYGQKDIVVLLTKQLIEKEKLKKQIRAKYIYVNENPYKQIEKEEIKREYLQ